MPISWEWKEPKHPIKCDYCGYTWRTRSKLGYVSCPNCGKKAENLTADLWKKETNERSN